MTATTDVLIPALREVREAEAALADRCRTHLAVTPAGTHRQTLERHLDDAKDHVRRVDERLDALRPHGPLQDALGGVRHLTGQAARIARLPLDVAMAVPAAALRGRTEATEHQLLKNAEDQYAVTAAAVATCRAGERIARGADDPATRDLLRTLRRTDQELLDALGASLEQYAEAVVATAAPGPSGTGRVRQTAERWEQRAKDTVARTQGELKGAAAAEDRLPIADYGRLDADQIIDRLHRLSQADLAVIDGYERAHANRSTVLRAIADLLGPVPWPGYDGLKAAEIRRRLRGAEAGLARQTLDYERRHRARSTVLAAAAERAAGQPATGGE
jgi:hypothetical protein